VAIGDGATATGNDSIALGISRASDIGAFAAGIYNNTTTYGAKGRYGVAIGRLATSTTSGWNTAALGPQSVGSGDRATALTNSYASGTDSFAAAIANNTSTYGATGQESVAIGKQAKATGLGSLAISANRFGPATSTSNGAVAIGDSVTASGSLSLAMGYNTTASASSAIAIGSGITNSTANQVVLGGTTQQVKISNTYTLPTTDGTNGQVLTTDGSGAVTFADAGGGFELYAENPSSPTAPSATGTNAVAIGSASLASNSNAIAAGFSSAAQGADSVAIGRGATSSNFSGATALGLSASAYGTQAVALGKSRASGTDSFAAAIANSTSSYGATGSNSIAIGQNAKATGVRAYALGRNSIASSTGSYSIGDDATASQLYAMAYGKKAKSDVQGKHAFGTFTVENSGNIQGGLHVLYVTTTDATAVALSTSNSAASTANQVILPNNSAYAFHGTIVARQKASAGTDCAAWKVEGLIRREGSAGTTVLVNSATTVLDNTPGWGLTLSADTTNGGLKIEATGAASADIKWVATINTSEVTYA
jgi:hypothetical protein